MVQNSVVHVRDEVRHGAKGVVHIRRLLPRDCWARNHHHHHNNNNNNNNERSVSTTVTRRGRRCSDPTKCNEPVAESARACVRAARCNSSVSSNRNLRSKCITTYQNDTQFPLLTLWAAQVPGWRQYRSPAKKTTDHSNNSTAMYGCALQHRQPAVIGEAVSFSMFTYHAHRYWCAERATEPSTTCMYIDNNTSTQVHTQLPAATTAAPASTVSPQDVVIVTPRPASWRGVHYEVGGMASS